jgi:hypothetical protein
VIPKPTKQTGISLFSPLALQTRRVNNATFEQSGRALKDSSESSFGVSSSCLYSFKLSAVDPSSMLVFVALES